MFSFAAPILSNQTIAVVRLHDTFSGTNGSLIVGRVPDTLGTNSWVKAQNLSTNGSIQSNKASELIIGTLSVVYDVGITEYTLSSTFSTTGENSLRAIGFFCRAPITMGGGSGLIWIFFNGTIGLYEIDTSTNVITLIGTTDTLSAVGTFDIEITVTSTNVSINVNSGSYTKSVPTTLYNTNTGVGMRFTGGIGYSVDEILVV